MRQLGTLLALNIPKSLQFSAETVGILITQFLYFSSLLLFLLFRLKYLYPYFVSKHKNNSVTPSLPNYAYSQKVTEDCGTRVHTYQTTRCDKEKYKYSCLFLYLILFSTCLYHENNLEFTKF